MIDKIQNIVLGIYGLLAVALPVLKLTGVIDLLWLWVVAPFWLPTVIVAIFLVAGFAIDLCRRIYLEIKRRNSNKW